MALNHTLHNFYPNAFTFPQYIHLKIVYKHQILVQNDSPLPSSGSLFQPFLVLKILIHWWETNLWPSAKSKLIFFSGKQDAIRRIHTEKVMKKRYKI